MSQEQETIIISTRRLDYKGSQQFFTQLFEAYRQGYEPRDTGLIKDSPRLGSVPRVVLYKNTTVEASESDSNETLDSFPDVGITSEEKELLASSESSEEDSAPSLEDITKKDELLAYAESLKIEVPANLKQPAAIKKFLQEYQPSE